MERSVVVAITSIAAEQPGAIATRQLRAAGMSARAQQRSEAAGWLDPVNRTAGVIAGSPDTWFRRLHLGLLTLRGRGWVSHEAAACLHELDRAPSDAVAFTVPRSARGVAGGNDVHTTACVGPLDVITVRGLRCSSATRTIIDLAHAGAPPCRLEAAIDSAVRLGCRRRWCSNAA